MSARKIIASVALLFTLMVTPSFAQSGNPYVQVQFRNGTVQTMRLHRAERIQARGEGVIVVPNTYYNNNWNGYYNNANGFYNGSYYPVNNVSPYRNSYYSGNWFYYQDSSGRWHRRAR